MSRSLRIAILAFGAVVIAMLAFDRWRADAPAVSAEPPPTYSEVPEFALTDQLGNTVTRSDFGGQPWIASFIFTRCGLSCPRMVSALKRVDARMPQGGKARIVAVTVDPTYDTVEVLNDYAAAHNVNHWTFLTGEFAAIRELSIGGFKLGVDASEEAAAASPDEPIVHSTRLVLVDSAGRIRGYYDGFEDQGIDNLVADVARLQGSR